jgi:hypothetical protein
MEDLKFGMAYVIGLRRAGVLKFFLVAAWFVVPFLAQMIQHPTHAAGFFFYWLQGQPVPRYFGSAEVTRAEFMALGALAAVVFVYLVVTTLIYRRAQFYVPLWPFAALLIGVVGNAGWWFGTGTWDTAGALAGFFPAALAGIASAVCEKLGADFVFGKGNRPAFDEEVDY